MSEVQVTLDQVKELIATNEEVREAVKGEFVNPETFTAFMDTEEGKKVLQPIKDRHATMSIDTWKKNNLDKIKQEAIASANPTETPEARRIRELEQSFKAMEQEKEHAKQEAFAISLATQKGLPQGLVPFMIGNSQEETISRANTVELEFSSALQQAIEGQLGTTGRNHLQAGLGAQQDAQVTPQHKSLEEMDYLEAARAFQANPNKFRQTYGV